jgi:NAD(P)-dependent dehydrogenase (short-subunit alcohol dehydrogenase family)
MPPQRKIVLITGCSEGGVGATLAQTLAQQGHHIYATARKAAKIPSSLRELDNVTTLQLDVSSAASIATASKSVRDAGLGLDVLVNNAGEEMTMPLLDVDVGEEEEGSAARDVFEVNFWGPLRLVQCFAHLLVERRGRVVNLTSADAELCPPWIGR